MGIPLLPEDFKEFLKLLDAKKVEYLLIGGYAVGYHGYVRATADMDVWISAKPDNAAKAVSALREVGFDMPDLSKELLLTPGNILRMGVPPFRLEVLNSISGVSFDECYAERIVDIIDDVEVPIISLRHLKINKKGKWQAERLGRFGASALSSY